MSYSPSSEEAKDASKRKSESQSQDRRTEERETDEANCCGNGVARNANKNVYGLAFCLFTNSFAYLGLQNIQSSVNKDAGLGLVSLSVVHALYVVSTICTVGIVKSVGTRYTVTIGLVGYLLYMVLNYYPSWYTLIPGSIAAGLGTGPIWIAGNCHVIAIAEKMAPVYKERKEVLVAKYLGILYVAYYMSIPPGNMASSLLFLFSESYGNGSKGNDTFGASCGLLSTLSIDVIYFYSLVSVYVFFQLLSVVGALVFIDNTFPIPPTLLGKAKALVTASTIKKVFNKNMLLLAPIGFYCGLELSFPSGAFAQIYISDCLGVSKVGFILMIFGVSSGAICFIYGSIVKYIPECLVLLLSGIIQAGLVIFLLLWERQPSYAAVIVFVIGWGAADAVWQITYSGFMAYLFPGDTTPAFGVSRMWIAFGLTTGFLSSYLASGKVAVILYLLLAVLVVATVFYITALFTTKSVEEVFLFSLYCPKRVSHGSGENEIAHPSSENGNGVVFSDDNEVTKKMNHQKPSLSLHDTKGMGFCCETTV